MDIHFHPTNTIYHQLINTADHEERARLFVDELFGPFDLREMGRMWGNQEPLAVAAQFIMLMPDQMDTVPPALTLLEEARAWEIVEAALHTGAARFAPYAAQIPMQATTAGIFLSDPAKASPMNRGYNGAGGTPGKIFITFDAPNDYNLPRLPGMTVHELHHNIRFSAVPWGPHTNVGDYMVSEGLAESFAAALYGEDIIGYYVTDVPPDELEIARRLIAENVTVSDFGKMRGYIFGSWIAGQMGIPDVGMPNFGGYAVGYHTVQAYLKRTGKTIEEATFVSAAEIIAESGYLL